MTLRLGITNDADLAPLFFPIEAGWVSLPGGTTTKTLSLSDLEKNLLDGNLDIAPVSPLTYAANTASLLLLPTPVRAFDLAADSIFLVSIKRLDQLEKVRVAISPNSAMGEIILKLIAPTYYGIAPDTRPVLTEAAALDALNGASEACVISGEAAMRAAGWAKSKGYFVEDITKAWWIMTGLPLPTYLFAVRKDWTKREENATAQVRSLIVALREGLQHSQDQRPTLLSRLEASTGLPAEALDAHYRLQRHDLNEPILRGLLEFYRRAEVAKLMKAPGDLDFFPALAPLAAAPPGPPRRTQPERAPNSSNNQKDQKDSKTNSRRADAQALGLRVIKGGKDKDDTETEDDDE